MENEFGHALIRQCNRNIQAGLIEKSARVDAENARLRKMTIYSVWMLGVMEMTICRKKKELHMISMIASIQTLKEKTV